jgi:succinate dehydrogenase flavin-adding protein (antitoxin of CptAB toxin-antitoxin module)
MTINDHLKKKIIYRSMHRGSKEMDLLLGNFVNFCIEDLNSVELEDLHSLMLVEDEILYKWHFHKIKNNAIKNNKISLLFQKFKL